MTRISGTNGTWSSSTVNIGCQSDVDTAFEAQLNYLKAGLEVKMANEVEGRIGYVQASLGACDDDAPCYTRNLVADAARWWGSADATLVSSSLVVSAPLQKFSIDAAELLSALPDLGTDLVRLDAVEGRSLRAALLNAIVAGQAETLHVSANLHVEWYVVIGKGIELATVTVNGANLDDNALYSVIASEADAVALGLKNPGNATISTPTPLGVQAYGAVSAYMRAFHGTSETALNPTLEYKTPRIERLADVQVLRVALLCGDDDFRLQQCDHALHAIELVNDKTDGLFDELLPFVRIEPYVANVGCGNDRALDGLADLSTSTNSTFDAVITACSGDVADVAGLAGRSILDSRTAGLQSGHAVISPSSTATSLADDAIYPYLARLATPELFNGKAVTELVSRYGWQRVAVVHDDSIFATEAAQAFVDDFLADNPSNEILGNGQCIGSGNVCTRTVNGRVGKAVGIGFSLAAMDASDDASRAASANEILRAVDALDAKIIYLSTYQRIQRYIFGASFRDDLLHGEGYAWINSLPSENAVLVSDDAVDSDAFRGIAGALGFIERRPTYADGGLAAEYLDTYWSARELSSEACVLPAVAVKQTYCDIDGDPRTTPDYALFWVDAIFLYARAVDTLPSSAIRDASAVYDAVLDLEIIDGYSGTIFLDHSTGDRRGDFNGLNFRIRGANVGSGDSSASDDSGSERRGRTLTVEAPGATGEYETVGIYYFQNDEFALIVEIEFPGGVTTPPLDRDPSTGTGSKGSSQPDNLFIFLFVLMAAVVVLGGMLICMFRRQYGASKKVVWVVKLAFTREGGISQDNINAESTLDDEESKVERLDGYVPCENTFYVNKWLYEDSDGNWVAYSDEHQSELAHKQRVWLDVNAETESRASATRSWDSSVEPPIIDLGDYIIDHREMSYGSTKTTPTMRGGVKIAGKRRVRCRIYFHEELYKWKMLCKNKKNPARDLDRTQYPGPWCRYDRQLEIDVARAYGRWLNGESDAPSKFYVTDHFAPASPEDEISQSGYEINFADLTQKRRTKDGVTRNLLVFLDPIPERQGEPQPRAVLRNITEEDTCIGLQESESSSWQGCSSCVPKFSASSQDKVSEGQKAQVDQFDGIPLTERMPRLEPGDIVRVDIEKQRSSKGSSRWIYGINLKTKEKGWCPRECLHARTYVPDIPDFWDEDDTGELKTGAIQVARETAEWRRVEEKLSGYTVVDIARIQNECRWDYYEHQLDRFRYRQNFRNQTKTVLHNIKVDSVIEEVPVYHGTPQENVQGIIERGFQIPTSGGNLGRGIYFAVHKEKAINRYAQADGDNRRHVFICRIIVGNAERGNSDFIPLPDSNDASTDSLKRKDRTEYCIFKPENAYPLYYVQVE